MNVAVIHGTDSGQKSNIVDPISHSEKNTHIAIDKTVILWYNYFIKLV